LELEPIIYIKVIKILISYNLIRKNFQKGLVLNYFFKKNQKFFLLELENINRLESENIPLIN